MVMGGSILAGTQAMAKVIYLWLTAHADGEDPRIVREGIGQSLDEWGGRAVFLANLYLWQGAAEALAEDSVVLCDDCDHKHGGGEILQMLLEDALERVEEIVAQVVAEAVEGE